MPIWAEVIAFSLAAYGLGLTAGWALWGRKIHQTQASSAESENPD